MNFILMISRSRGCPGLGVGLAHARHMLVINVNLYSFTPFNGFY
jgi:hypothetical protein